MHFFVELDQPVDWLNVVIQLVGILLNAGSLLFVGYLAYRSSNTATEMAALVRDLETTTDVRDKVREAAALALTATANIDHPDRGTFVEAKSLLDLLLDPGIPEQRSVINHLDGMSVTTDLPKWRNDLAMLVRIALKG